jgi:hypothetical protein
MNAAFFALHAYLPRLRPAADAEMAQVLDATGAEIGLGRGHREDFGCHLTVVQPA